MILDSFAQDVRIGLRILFKEKSFCFLAVLVLLTLIAMATLSSGVGMLERWFNGPAQVEAREE